MKKNKTYESLIEKSISSMLSAIEIYNKPDFKYREETFAILSVNAWELLFKAYIYKTNKYNAKSIYCCKPHTNKDGSKSKRIVEIEKNRSGNPKSISISEAMNRLKAKGDLPTKLKENVESLIELRDNAIHLLNMKPISKQVQELGFACIKNYVTILQKWERGKSLSNYNLYLMPLAYVDDKVFADSTMTKETANFINLIKEKIDNADEKETDYDIAIRIELKFQKGDTFNAVSVHNSKDGLPITLSDEDMRSRFPWTHEDVMSHARQRYSDFKRDKKFIDLMTEIKKNNKLCYERKLDSQSPKTITKKFYSSGVLQEFDKHYKKK